MNSERMIKEVRYLRNRKIVKVRESDHGHFCLHFDDGNFCVFGGKKDYARGPAAEFLEDLDGLGPEALYDMEIISDKEFESLIKAREVRWNECAREGRRQQYEILKSEFEGDGS